MRTWSEVKALLADPPRLWAGLVGRLFRRPSLNSQKLQYLRELKIVGSGILAAERGQDTPRAAHVALMNLFMASGGRANDLLSAVVGFFHPRYRLPGASGVLG